MSGCERLGLLLEEKGWRQGSIVKAEDAKRVIDALGIDVDDSEACVFIVASQSCDIANDNIKIDPSASLSLGRLIDKVDGNRSFNKNPRVLHTTIECFDESAVSVQKSIELFACDKFSILKKELSGFDPCSESIMAKPQLDTYVDWLAARYKRPAHPTKFNNLLNMNKLKKKAKSCDGVLSGVYVEVFPDKEISEGEVYAVNLLGLYPAEYEGGLESAKEALKFFEDMMREAGMEVRMVLQSEGEISVARFKKFKRFYFDEISYKSGSSLPPEVECT